jgi:two-component system OmpR family response regulator
MPKVVLIGLEQLAASHICRALASEGHHIELKSRDVVVPDLLDADIVFAGGEPGSYLSLLRRLRAARPSVPFVVVTEVPETREWLDALEAGATDYCSAPFESKHISWLMESALPRSRSAAA